MYLVDLSHPVNCLCRWHTPCLSSSLQNTYPFLFEISWLLKSLSSVQMAKTFVTAIQSHIWYLWALKKEQRTESFEIVCHYSQIICHALPFSLCKVFTWIDNFIFVKPLQNAGGISIGKWKHCLVWLLKNKIAAVLKLVKEK